DHHSASHCNGTKGHGSWSLDRPGRAQEKCGCLPGGGCRGWAGRSDVSRKAPRRRPPSRRSQMKYMLMMNATKADWSGFGKMPPEDIMAYIRFMKGLNEELKASREFVDAQG